MARHKEKFSPWLVGLIIAIVVFVAVLIVFAALGFGDDPVVESAGALIG